MSPEQISYDLLHIGIFISHERIYQHIWSDKKSSGKLHQHLRHAHKKYRKRGIGKDLHGHIPNRKSIEERPGKVDNHNEFGHWEADTIIDKSHKGALVSLVERKSRIVLIASVVSKAFDCRHINHY